MKRTNMCTTLVLVLALALGCAALSPIAFRLDDVQCGYMQSNSMAIMDAFLRNNVPLTIGLITAPPLNWQGNFDCHVPDILTRKANFASAGVGFELASHSVTHELITTMTPEQQWYQLNTSKVHIETKFDTQVTTFLPPQNQWNADMVALGVTAGYKIWSGQCGAGQMNGASADGACIVNMRRDISPSFFGAIDNMIHAPVGAVTASTSTGQYLTVDQMMASTTACESTYCSINSQMQGNIARTQGGASWGIVMMHPQEFPNTTVIDTFFDDLLTRVKAVYAPYTIRDLVTAVSGTTFPSSTGGSGQTSSSTGSASSSSSASASSSSTGTITDGSVSSSSSGSASSSSSSTGVAMDSSSSSGSSLSNSTSSTLSSSTGLGLTNGSSSIDSSSSSSSTGSISSAYSTSSISFASIVMASFAAIISMVTSML